MFNVSVYKYKNGVKRYYRQDAPPIELMTQAMAIDPQIVAKGVVQWFYDDTSNNLGLVVPWIKDIGIYGNRHAVTKCDFDLTSKTVHYEQYFIEELVDLPSNVGSMLDGVKITQYSVVVDQELTPVEYSAYLHDIDIGLNGLNSFAAANNVELNADDADNLGGIAIKWYGDSVSTSAYYWGS